MRLSKLTASVTLAVAAMTGLMATSAHAGVTFYSPETTFEDDNNDWHFDTNNNGLIDIGERLVSVLEIGKTADPNGSASSNIGPQELTGIIDAIVLAKIPVGFAGSFIFLFGPNAASTYVDGANGEIARAWLDASPDLDLPGQTCTSLVDCTNKASDGSLYFSAGFTGDPDEIFAFQGTDATAVVQAAASGNPLTVATFAFNVIVNNTGRTFLDIACAPNAQTVGPSCNPSPSGVGGDGFTTMTGGGAILGGSGLTNGAFGRSDFDFNVKVAPAPEPSALALVGLALVGLGLTRRRKNA